MSCAVLFWGPPNLISGHTHLWRSYQKCHASNRHVCVTDTVFFCYRASKPAMTQKHKFHPYKNWTWNNNLHYGGFHLFGYTIHWGLWQRTNSISGSEKQTWSYSMIIMKDSDTPWCEQPSLCGMTSDWLTGSPAKGFDLPLYKANTVQ